MTVLVITNKIDVSADRVIKSIEEKAGTVFRLNTEDVGQHFLFNLHWSGSFYSDGEIISPLRTLKLADIQSIWYRRPLPVSSIEGCDEEAEKFIREETSTFLKWLWIALRDRFWISIPYKIRIAESKIDQLSIAQKFGLGTPKTLITNSQERALAFWEECGGNIIVKVLRQPVIRRGDSVFTVYCTRVSRDDLLKMPRINAAPSILQEYVEKKVELRVTVVGKAIFAAEIRSQESERTKDDWRRYDIPNTPHRGYTLPRTIERACREMVSHYGLAFGAIDLIVTPCGNYVFLELNPNGQWGWIEDLTGLPISDAIGDLLLNPTY